MSFPSLNPIFTLGRARNKKVVTSLLIRRIVLSIVVGLISFSMLYAQIRKEGDRKGKARPKPVLVPDSTRVQPQVEEKKPSTALDSLRGKRDTLAFAHPDSTVIDSVRIRFIAGLGSLTGMIDTTSVLDRRQFLWTDAKYLGELMWKVPGFFWRDLGEDGTWGQLNAYGVDGRSIGILLDGRPMNDPVTGTFNLYDIPLEFIDYVEVLNGSPSMMTTMDATGTSLNLVSRSYNSYHPMTKIRFVQDPKETLLTDGLFTQNIARGLNLMIGIQRHVSQGRHANTSLDAWNIRTRLRYNISTRLNVSLTDFYTKANNGLNGGLSQAQPVNFGGDETGASVNNERAWDLRMRRDVTLSAIAHALADSSSTTQTSLFYSTLEREYGDPPNSSPTSVFHTNNIDDFTKTSFWGIRFQQRINVAPFSLTVGAQLERRECDPTRILPAIIEIEQSGFGSAEARLIKSITPSFSFRYTSLRGKDFLNVGAGVKAGVSKWITFSADVLWADRPPTLQELYWRDSTVFRPAGIAMEHHKLIQGGLNVQASSNIQLSVTGFQRTIKNAILYSPTVTNSDTYAIEILNVDDVKVLGLNGQITLHWGPIEAFGVMTLSQYKQKDTLKIPVPDVMLTGEVVYRNMFFKDKLDVKFGVRSQFNNRQYGMHFDPQTLSYVQYRLDILGRSSTIDFFMIAKIGDAYISLSWDNILNTTYILAPIYPMAGRHLRIGVNWIFID